MTKPNSKFQPPSGQVSPKFSEPATFMRLPYTKELQGVDLAFVGVPFDGGTSFRPGARFGPRAIREASTFLRPYHPILRVNLLELNAIDYGDLDTVPGYIEASFAKIQEGVTKLLAQGVVPLIMGGDHSITLPILRAYSQKYGKLSLIQIDAHSDLWDEYFGEKYNHGTTMRRAIEEGLIDPKKSIQVGLRGPLYEEKDASAFEELGIRAIFMEDLERRGIQKCLEEIKATVEAPYLSFDIDSVDPAFAPGTGTPEVGGFTSREVLALIRGLKGLNLLGADLVEVSPPYDQGEITAFLAANLLYEIACLIVHQKR